MRIFKNYKFLVLTFIIVFSCAFFFVFSLPCLATVEYIDTYSDFGSGYSGWTIFQSFSPVGKLGGKIEEIRLKNVRLTSNCDIGQPVNEEFEFILCEGSIVEDEDYNNYYCLNEGQSVVFSKVIDIGDLGLSTSTPQEVIFDLSLGGFSSSQDYPRIEANKIYYWSWRNTDSGEWGLYDCGLEMEETQSNFYSEEYLYNYSLYSDFSTSYFSLKWQLDLEGYETDEAEAIEETDQWGNPTTTIGTDAFSWVRDTYCYYDTYDTCKIGFSYSEDYIGAMAVLLKYGQESIGDFDDYIYELPDNSTLTGWLYPIHIEEASTTEYSIYVTIPDDEATSSHELFYPVYVYWVASTTGQADNDQDVFFIIKAFKNIFPLSLYFQIKSIFDKYTTDSELETINITLQDIIPPEYSGISSTSNLVLLDENIISDNLSIWDNLIYPILQNILWVLTFIYIILKLKSLFHKTEEI